MLRILADHLNSMNLVVNSVKQKYPNEEIIFSSAASILQTKGDNPVGWSFKRIFQQRGIAVFTRERIFLKSSFYSLFTLIHIVIIVSCLILYFRNSEFIYLLISVLSGVYILQRLPYQTQIPVVDIKDVKLNPVYGATGRYSLLTVTLENRSINIVTAQNLSEEVKEILSPNSDMNSES